MLFQWRHFGLAAAAAMLGVLAANGAARSEAANRAPIITGKLGNGSVGAEYYFLPVAKDPEGDALTFTLTGAPSWMKFRASDGRIVGRPLVAAVYSNIVLSVRDTSGNTTSLAPETVTITATPGTGKARLNWKPPTQNASGKSLTNLAGYRIYFGQSASEMTERVEIASPGASAHTIEGLAPGTWYFTVSAYASDGSESVISNIATKVVK